MSKSIVTVEYIITHIWLVLVIAIVVLSIVKLNPLMITTKYSRGLKYISLIDWKAIDSENDLVKIIISPKISMKITNVTIDTNWVCFYPNVSLKQGNKYEITCVAKRNFWSKNEYYDLKINIEYKNLYSGLDHKETGKISGKTVYEPGYIFFDAIPPQVEILYPEENTTYLENNLIKVFAKDNNKIKNVIAEIDEKENITLENKGFYFYAYNLSIEREGKHKLKVYAIDQDNNVNTTSVEFYIKPYWTYFNHTYRETIYLDNFENTSMDNVQVRINISKSKYMKDDYSDLKFSDNHGNKLKYWIEDKTPNYTIVWVKIPKMYSRKPEEIYLYYGNPNSTSESNGSLVFDYFESFEDGMNGWTGDWVRTTDNSYEGNYSAENIDTTHGGYFCMNKNITINETSRIGFFWMTDGRYDEYTEFLVDDKSISKIFGYKPWREFNTDIESGTHNIKFCHYIDTNGNVGEADKGWVDAIKVYKKYNITSSFGTTKQKYKIPLFIDIIYPKNKTYFNVSEINVITFGKPGVKEVVAEIDKSYNKTLINVNGTDYYKNSINLTDGKHTIRVIVLDNNLEEHIKEVYFIVNSKFTQTKEIEVYNPYNYDLTNVQVKFNITYHQNMQNDFSDVRFFYNGTQLPYWIEDKVNNSYAIFWTKVPLLKAGENTTILLKYGNHLLNYTGNGTNVFELYDDFDKSDINYEIWNYTELSNGKGDGYYTIENSTLKLYGPSEYKSGGYGFGFISHKSFEPNTRIMVKLNYENNWNGRTDAIGFSINPPNYWPNYNKDLYAGWLGGSGSGSDGNRSCHLRNSNGSIYSLDIPCFNTPKILEIIRSQETTIIKIENESYTLSDGLTNNSSNVIIWVGGGWADQGKRSRVDIDWIAVAKYVELNYTILW